MNRTEAKEKIKRLGGIVTNAVNKDLTFLVTNDTDSGSSKNEKASEYNVSTICEYEFYNIIKNPEKVKVYMNRGYEDINIADNKVGKDILVKYKGKGVDLDSIKEERDTLKNIQACIRENEITYFYYCFIIGLARLYYKYQDIDAVLLSESLKYYLRGLDLLPKYNDFIEQVKSMYAAFNLNRDEEYLSGRIGKIRNELICRADETFKRIIIIYEKQGLYENALEICDKAIKFGENNDYYIKKMEKLKLKTSGQPPQSAGKRVWLHKEASKWPQR
jgi:tetratricopeptide (TPR) repeat protein